MRGGPLPKAIRVRQLVLPAMVLCVATSACGATTNASSPSEVAQLPSGEATSGSTAAGSSTSSTAAGTASSAPAGGRIRKLEGRTEVSEPDDPELEETTTTIGDPEAIRQWGSWAEATSTYGPAGSTDWDASQATGAPDVDPQCQDDPHAWASATRDEVATLTVHYDVAVQATELNVYQTFNPGQVSRLDLLGPDGEVSTVYEGEPAPADGCPVTGYLQELAVGHPVVAIAVTIDQSVLGTGWAEIDAVELVGVPVG